MAEQDVSEERVLPSRSCLMLYNSDKDFKLPSFLPVLTATRLLGMHPRRVPALTIAFEDRNGLFIFNLSLFNCCEC